MIYKSVSQDAPIRQGDIFRDLPITCLPPAGVLIVGSDGSTRECNWGDLGPEREGVSAIVQLFRTWGVVASQDCDALRAPEITLCQIREFRDVVRFGPPTTPRKWASLIVRECRVNLKWFYLPPDPAIGFTERMAVDFQVPFRVPRESLETLLSHRLGRLNDVADEHFRERLSEYFRRYPYDEWYPFTKEEFEAYARDVDEPVEPYPWQR